MFYEIILKEKKATAEDWKKLIDRLYSLTGYFSLVEIYVSFDSFFVTYYIKTKRVLPSSVEGCPHFFFVKCDALVLPKVKRHFSILPIWMNFICLRDYIHSKYHEKVSFYKVKIRKIKDNQYIANGLCITEQFQYSLPFIAPFFALEVDFFKDIHLKSRGVPKYFDLTKHISNLQAKSDKNILKISMFPFDEKENYYTLDSYSFWKHSLVFGTSGCGKSKFISSFIYQLYCHYKENYKVILIDPHASLEKEIGDLGSVIRFIGDNRINLFSSNEGEIITNVEMLLSLFKNLIANYNTKLERVLRYSIYVLLKDNHFCFTNLRKIVLDLEYRSLLIRTYKEELPDSVVSFFLTEYANIKTQYYGEAISPIIAFIDEMEMLPVFNREQGEQSLLEEIKGHFLTLFSLDRTRLGDQTIKTISGLLMQQLMDIISNHSIDQHIIFIIDEVALVENPILIRFLSEARKYNLSLILCGQYFNQLSPSLKDSIYANVVNYFLFRLSYLDAEVLSRMIGLKLSMEDSIEKRCEALNQLRVRECIFRIEQEGTLLPAIKGKTLDFNRDSHLSIPKEEENVNPSFKNRSYSFSIEGGDLKELMKKSSTSRMVFKE